MKHLMIALVMTGAIPIEAAHAQENAYPRVELLIEPDELAKAVKQYRILDARSFEKYKEGHIPGAMPVGHAVWAKEFGHGQNAKAWSERIGKAGITSESKVVIYDDVHTKDAARIWWILRYWGVADVRILNGGWVGWTTGKHPIEKDPNPPKEEKFTAKAQSERLATKEQLIEALKLGKLQIIDARTEKEFCGIDKLSNKRAGAIPGAKNLEWIDLLDKETHRFKSPDALRKIFEEAGIALDRPTTTHCQSGGRAAVMVFGMELMGAKDVRNYYPSWAEWSHDPDAPVVKGKAK